MVRKLFKQQWLLERYLALASFSGFVIIFLINEKMTFLDALPRLEGSIDLPWDYVVYFMAPIFLAWISLKWINHFPSGETLEIAGNDIVPVEGNYLPTYIGMYVISLELNSGIETLIISIFLFILWFQIGSVSYFNPFLSLIGYRYYAVRSKGNKTITVITKDKDLKQADKLTGLVRINNYTFFKKKG